MCVRHSPTTDRAVPCRVSPDDHAGRTLVGDAIDSNKVQLMFLIEGQPTVAVQFEVDAACRLRDLLTERIDAIER